MDTGVECDYSVGLFVSARSDASGVSRGAAVGAAPLYLMMCESIPFLDMFEVQNLKGSISWHLISLVI